MMEDLFNAMNNSTTGIFRGWLGAYRITHSCANHLIIEAGQAFFRRKKLFYYYDGAGENGTGLWSVPDGKSSIVVRADYKEEKVRIVVLRHSWRRVFEEWWNKLVKRYVDIPIYEVNCKNGWVEELEDVRQYSEFHLSD